MQGITAVQVRRDLMLIGFSSDTKKGYDVEVLIDFINGILDSPTPMNIAVIGMGHLGQVITRYFNGKGLNLKIVAAFDVDPEKVGQTIEEIPCYSMDDFRGPNVSNTRYQHSGAFVPVADSLRPGRTDSQCRHQGVLNFTSKPLNFPLGIVVENYDITTLLEKVAYFVKENEENNEM